MGAGAKADFGSADADAAAGWRVIHSDCARRAADLSLAGRGVRRRRFKPFSGAIFRSEVRLWPRDCLLRAVDRPGVAAPMVVAAAGLRRRCGGGVEMSQLERAGFSCLW